VTHVVFTVNVTQIGPTNHNAQGSVALL